MANGGTFQGRSILSEETHAQFHSEPIMRNDYMANMKTIFTKGGASLNANFSSFYGVGFGSAATEMNKQNEGFYGWWGAGGSSFLWSPELKMSYAYLPSDSMFHPNMVFKSQKYQAVAAECARKLQTSSQNKNSIN